MKRAAVILLLTIVPIAPSHAALLLSIETFTSIADPMRMSSDGNDGFFVGRSNNGSGGLRSDPVSIYRVDANGDAVEFGAPTSGPAAVLLDEHARFVEPGWVLVGGVTRPNLRAILPDETIEVAFSSVPGPSDMAAVALIAYRAQCSLPRLRGQARHGTGFTGSHPHGSRFFWRHLTLHRKANQ